MSSAWVARWSLRTVVTLDVDEEIWRPLQGRVGCREPWLGSLRRVRRLAGCPEMHGDGGDDAMRLGCDDGDVRIDLGHSAEDCVVVR
jgi:hypothetical protein